MTDCPKDFSIHSTCMYMLANINQNNKTFISHISIKVQYARVLNTHLNHKYVLFYIMSIYLLLVSDLLFFVFVGVVLGELGV